MRILATSDWHLDATTAGLARLPELEAYVSYLVAAVRTEKVDLVLHLGDVLDPGHLFESMYQRNLLEYAASLTKAATYGSLWIPGNHDVLDTDTPLSTLSALECVSRHWQTRPLRTEDEVGVPHWLSVVQEPKVSLYPGVAVLCLPYVSRAWTMSVFNKDRLKGALEAAARVRKAGSRKLVVISHLSLPGMHPGSEDEMPHGREVPFPVEEVKALKPDLVLQGHYHEPQEVDVSGLKVQVVGAPLRFTFGERKGAPRGYVLVDL